MSTKKKRAVTGIRSSGNVHIGNYLGMIKPALAMQNQYDCYYFIADMHSLTTNRNAAELKEQVLDIVATWLALGFDANKHALYRQSDVPMVAEYAWYLSCCTGIGFLEKGHAYKDALSNNRDVNHGILAYPVLMAADIVMYDADIVPVGKDQKQHVEMARDIAGSFNAAYQQEVVKLPEVKVDERVMSIPGLDGRKMSKSYKNEIALFSNEETLKKQIMSIKTDSTPLESPKSLKSTFIGELYALFATQAQYDELEKKLNQGGMGWGHVKEELFRAINDDIKTYRKRYFELRADTQHLRAVLKSGATKAYQTSLPVLNRIRQAIGFEPLALVMPEL